MLSFIKSGNHEVQSEVTGDLRFPLTGLLVFNLDGLNHSWTAALFITNYDDYY